MGIITRMRKQDAVYWPISSVDNYGQPVLGTPVQIRCRWEDRNEEFVDVNGTQLLSSAVVYVDRDVVPGGVLMLGTLADITDADNPKENDNAYEIRRFDNLPDIRAKEFLKTAWM